MVAFYNRRTKQTVELTPEEYTVQLHRDDIHAELAGIRHFLTGVGPEVYELGKPYAQKMIKTSRAKIHEAMDIAKAAKADNTQA